MSDEMKPVARVDGRWSDGCAMVRTLEAGANMPLGTELYTAEQLTEAVAAERERCAKVCGELGGVAKSGYGPTSYDPENRGADCAEDMAERIAEAIRSAAK